MKLESVEIENYRAIEKLRLPLDPSLTVLHGGNTCGKTSVLSAIAIGLGGIPRCLPNVSTIRFAKTDLRNSSRFVRVSLAATNGIAWQCERLAGGKQARHDTGSLREMMESIVSSDRTGKPAALPIVVFYDTDRSIVDRVKRQRGYAGERGPRELHEEHPYAEKDPYSQRYVALEGALSAQANFWQFFRWFRAKEDQELREQKKRRDFDYRQRDLSAVRNAYFVNARGSLGALYRRSAVALLRLRGIGGWALGQA